MHSKKRAVHRFFNAVQSRKHFPNQLSIYHALHFFTVHRVLLTLFTAHYKAPAFSRPEIVVLVQSPAVTRHWVIASQIHDRF